jgi:membrane protein YdbS with pleckstrin-like domain
MGTLRKSIPLQSRKVVKKAIGGVVGILALSFFCATPFVIFYFSAAQELPESVSYIAGRLAVVVMIVLVLMLLTEPVYEYYYWARYFYDMDEHNIVVRKGVFAQKEITIPFSRITDVYVDQDLLDVLFGLYDVHVSTPTEESGKFAHIDGIDKAGSQHLRQMILDRINEGS